MVDRRKRRRRNVLTGLTDIPVVCMARRSQRFTHSTNVEEKRKMAAEIFSCKEEKKNSRKKKKIMRMVI